MAKLTVIFIDVGWGDSVFIEYENDQGKKRYCLVDSNDSTESLSSYTFIKRHFEENKIAYKNKAAFDIVLLTHWHLDHYSGLKRIIKKFGTHRFWYPKSDKKDMSVLLKYANSSKARIVTHEAVNLDKTPPKFGDVDLAFHWPPYTEEGPYDDDPNNTSVVLELSYDGVRFLLTGDCLAENWNEILQNTKKTRLKMIQAPHHGAKNGMFRGTKTPWLDFIGKRTKVALSSHIHPYKHPHKNVIKKLAARKQPRYRTDEHYHLTFVIEKGKLKTKWSHF